MRSEGTLLLRRSDVETLLTLSDCIEAVERVFRLHGEGKIPASKILGVQAPDGGLHVKAAFLPDEKSYLVAKLNTNYPGNQARFDLPTIQGVILLSDAENGSPLALIDSIDITIKRTAAATAVAAKFLARQDSSVVTICGCGVQARNQLRAICSVLALKTVYAFDLDENAAATFANERSRELKILVQPVRDVPDAVSRSDVIITCTPSREYFVHKENVGGGTFIAAVGADDAHKQEIDPALMASAKVVADSLEQCCAIGDTHHAIAKRLMSKEDIYAELSEVVAGQKRGRVADNEIIVFDSTGVAMEDAVVATTVYQKAGASGIGTHFEFAA
jgi:alanine dehydrogenase